MSCVIIILIIINVHHLFYMVIFNGKHTKQNISTSYMLFRFYFSFLFYSFPGSGLLGERREGEGGSILHERRNITVPDHFVSRRDDVGNAHTLRFDSNTPSQKATRPKI